MVARRTRAAFSNTRSARLRSAVQRGNNFGAAEAIDFVEDPDELREGDVADKEIGLVFGEEAENGPLLGAVVAGDEADEKVGIEGDHLRVARCGLTGGAANGGVDLFLGGRLFAGAFAEMPECAGEIGQPAGAGSSA